MTLRIRTPVPLADLLVLLAASSGAAGYKPVLHRALVLQGVRSDTVGFYDGDTLIAAVCLYPCTPERPGEDLRELAFLALPAAARHMLGIVHYARLTRAHLAHDPCLRIRAVVRSDAGRRLALLCGLTPAAGSNGVLEWKSPSLPLSRPRPAPAAGFSQKP